MSADRRAVTRLIWAMWGMPIIEVVPLDPAPDRRTTDKAACHPTSDDVRHTAPGKRRPRPDHRVPG